jgi:hypothetical protein
LPPVWDPVLDHAVATGFCEAVAGKAAEAGSVDQHLLHQGIRQREPLLQEVDAQHHLQYERRTPALGRRVVVPKRDQRQEGIPGNRGFHFIDKTLPAFFAWRSFARRL